MAVLSNFTAESYAINSTAFSPSILPPSGSSILLTWIYTSFLAISLLLNTPVFFTIVTSTELRSRPEMVALASVSGWEVVYGIFYFWLGVKTIALSSLGPLATGWTPLQCLVQIYNLPLAFSSAVLYTTLMFLAIDRFLLILYFHKYKKFRTRYKLIVLLLPLCWGVGDISLYIVGTMKKPDVPNIHPAACTLGLCAYKDYLNYKDEFVIYPVNIASILTYAVAMMWLKLKKNSFYAALQAIERQRQKKVNKLFCILAVITFCTLMLPRMMTFVMTAVAYQWWNDVGAFYSNVLTCSHSMLYGIVFWARGSEIRSKLFRKTGIKKLWNNFTGNTNNLVSSMPMGSVSGVPMASNMNNSQNRTSVM